MTEVFEMRAVLEGLAMRLPAQMVAELRRLGHEVDLIGDYDEVIGRAGAAVGW